MPRVPAGGVPAGGVPACGPQRGRGGSGGRGGGLTRTRHVLPSQALRCPRHPSISTVSFYTLIPALGDVLRRITRRRTSRIRTLQDIWPPQEHRLLRNGNLNLVIFLWKNRNWE